MRIMGSAQNRKSTAVGGAEQAAVVLSVVFPYARVGPYAVGGAEVVCSQLEAAIGSLGFQSVVVAHAGSSPEGRLYGTQVPEGAITDEVRSLVEAAQQANIDRALEENAVCLVHMHGLDFHRYRLPEDLPVLVTLHLPPSWYPKAIWELPANYHFACVSESQRQACPETSRSRMLVVDNGVPIPPENTLRSKGHYALMLSRICPEKNLHTGLDAARLAGLPSILGGETFPYPAHEQYFREEIEPRLTAFGETHEGRGERENCRATARFLGTVSQVEKPRVLGRAACLLLPSLAPETSSLVAMEAMAAGVPVIGMTVGAVPDLVEDGKTGFLVQPSETAAEAMAEAIRRLPELDRSTCRAAAEKRFPLGRMVERYAGLYRELALSGECATERTGRQQPIACTEAAAQIGQAALGGRGELLIQRISAEEDLAQLAPEWEALWRADKMATPFQHPGWLLPWWRQFGPDGALCARTLRANSSGKLLGMVPLYVYRDASAQRRKLLLMGAGTSDYLDGVWCADGEQMAGAVLRDVLSSSGDWDLCTLQQLQARSPLVQAGRSSGADVEASEPTSLVDVSAELPAKIRANVSRYRRRAEKLGDLRLHVAEEEREAVRIFDLLVAFHRRRWEERGETGVFADARVLAHHREAIPQLLAAGILRLFHLTHSGRTVGILYSLADGAQRMDRRLYLYLIGFDSQFAALSPGTLLLHGVWQYAREHGFGKLDLLRGGEEYKSFWGAVTEKTFSLDFDRPGSAREKNHGGVCI